MRLSFHLLAALTLSQITSALGANSVEEFAAEWLTKNQFPPPPDYPKGKLPAISISTSLSSDDLAIQAGFGIFEFEAGLDKKTRKVLKNGSLFVVAPGYQRFKVAGGINGNLEKTITHDVDAGQFAKGNIKIFLEPDQKTVSMSWKLSVQFAGDLNDKTCFFDIERAGKQLTKSSDVPEHDKENLHKLAAYYSGGVDTLWFKNPHNVLASDSRIHTLSHDVLAEEPNTAEYGVALKLVEDYVTDHYDSTTGNFVVGSDENSKSKEYSFDVSFLSIQLVGNIDSGAERYISAALYIKIPIIGSVKLASISGPLLVGGKTQPLTTSVNVAVTKGSVTLTLEDGTLYAALSLDVKFIGPLKADKVKLFKLP